MFFKPATVDTAIAPLVKAVSDLERVSQDRIDTVTLKHQQVQDLEVQIKIDDAESARAGRILAKLKAIIEE